MTINNLRDIIRDYGVECNWRHDLDGRELLEHVEDVPGFVELLGKFFRRDTHGHDAHGYVGFVNDYPYPIRVMLDRDVVFSYYKFGRICGVRFEGDDESYLPKSFFEKGWK